MKKPFFILPLLLILLLPSLGWGATYYANVGGSYTDPSGNVWGAGADANPGTMVAPKKTIKAATDLGTSAGDITLIAPGTYTNANNDRISSAAASTTIQGVDPNNRPILAANPSTYNGIYINHNSVTVSNLIIQNVTVAARVGISVVANKTSVSINNIDLFNCGVAATMNSVSLLGGSTGTITRLRIYGDTAAGSGYCVSITTAAAWTFNYCWIDGNFNTRLIGFYDASLGATTINNCLVFGVRRAFYHTASGAVTKTINNSILLGRRTPGATTYTVEIANATSVGSVNNSIIGGGYLKGETNYYYSNGTLTFTSEVTGPPKFKAMGYNFGIVVPIFDWDNYNDQVYLDAGTLLSSLGVHATYIVNAVYFDVGYGRTTANLTTLQGQGHDIGSHGWSHTSLANLTLDVMAVRYVGAGTACTMTIAGETNNALTLVTTVDTVQDLNIDLTTYNGTGSTTSLAGLCTAIDTLANYTCTWSGGVDTPSQRARASSIADVTDQPIKAAAYTVVTDPVRLEYNEIIKNNEWIETTIGGGYACRSYGYANNSVSATTAAYMRALDGTSAGQKVKMVRAGESETNINLSAFDPVLGLAVQANTMAAFTTAQLQHRFRDVGLQALQNGQIFFLYMHAADWSASAAPNPMSAGEKVSFTTAMQALIDSGVRVMSMREVYDYLNTAGNGWTWNAGAGTWDKTLTDIGDGNLQPGSSAINAGTNIPWTGVVNIFDFFRTRITDGSGNIVAPGGTVDTGVSEFVPVGSMMNLRRIGRR